MEPLLIIWDFKLRILDLWNRYALSILISVIDICILVLGIPMIFIYK